MGGWGIGPEGVRPSLCRIRKAASKSGDPLGPQPGFLAQKLLMLPGCGEAGALLAASLNWRWGMPCQLLLEHPKSSLFVSSSQLRSEGSGRGAPSWG